MTLLLKIWRSGLQQLSTYNAKKIKPIIKERDRSFWIALKKSWSKWTDTLIIVKPETIIDWQRRRFKGICQKKDAAMLVQYLDEEIQSRGIENVMITNTGCFKLCDHGDENIIKASLSFGASKFYTFRRISVPLAKNGIYSGMVMTWARAMGEFGATSMVAGCVPFKTETMTIVIYKNAMSGNLSSSISIAILLTLFSFTFLALYKLMVKKGRMQGIIHAVMGTVHAVKGTVPCCQGDGSADNIN